MPTLAHAERSPAAGPVRRCSCGKPIVACGECASCRRRREQQVAGTKPGRPGGRPLDQGVRARFESALGHDFGDVRIHADAPAAADAQRAGAQAYTLDRDVVFNRGHYAPNDRGGARLLAHELVHVVQQGGVAPLSATAASPGRSRAGTDRAQALAGLPRLPSGAGGAQRAPATTQTKARDGRSRDAFEQEADRLAERVVSGAGRSAPALRGASAPQAQLQIQPKPPRLLGGQLRAPPPPPAIPPGSIPEAFVFPDIPAPPRLQLTGRLGDAAPRPRVPSLVGSLTGPPPVRPMFIVPVPRCVPARPLTWADFPANAPPGGFAARTDWQVSPLTVQGNPMFQLRLSATSAVRPVYRNPANRATNGCASHVAACRRSMNANPGGTWNFTIPNPNPCPASILPSPAAVATTAAECDTVAGAECDRAIALESPRLLRHEQGHFDISCGLTNKANDALRAGTDRTTVDNALAATAPATQAAYDNQTNHGCDAAAQAAWEADIAAGLPTTPLP